MIKTLKSIENKVLLSAILIAIGIILCIQNLVFYLIPSLTTLVFLAITPFVFRLNKNDKRLRFAWLSLVFIILYYFFKMQLLYFLSFSTFILFIIESRHGKVNILPIFIILLISPYSDFIFNVFGFPIRLYLTQFASHLLSFVFKDISHSGNIIILNGDVFSVDPECIGLTMIGYAYASTLLFIASFEKKYSKKITFLKILAILSISSVFIVLVNLFRIVIIVVLKSAPDSIAHQVLGLLTFVIYFIIPMYFISRYLIKNDKNKLTNQSTSRTSNKNIVYLFTILLMLSLAGFNYYRDGFRNIQTDNKMALISLDGFSKSQTEENVLKFESEENLIYIKPSCSFFSPDHNPMICWKGSGYEFINIKTKQFGEYEIYTAELQKDDEVLQTAWWFDNGEEKTISQLDWRWRTASGEEAFRLINITSLNKIDLDKQVQEIIGENLFSERD